MSGGRVILLVEDDAGHAQLALRALERSEGLEVIVVESIAEARGTLGRQHVDLVLADLHLPDGSGLDLLDQPVPVVVQTSQGDEARAVTAMKGGAKPKSSDAGLHESTWSIARPFSVTVLAAHDSERLTETVATYSRALLGSKLKVETATSPGAMVMAPRAPEVRNAA